MQLYIYATLATNPIAAPVYIDSDRDDDDDDYGDEEEEDEEEADEDDNAEQEEGEDGACVWALQKTGFGAQHTERERERERERDRQTDRQTQTNRRTDRRRDGQTETDARTPVASITMPGPIQACLGQEKMAGRVGRLRGLQVQEVGLRRLRLLHLKKGPGKTAEPRSRSKKPLGPRRGPRRGGRPAASAPPR